MPHSAVCETGVMTNCPLHFQVYSHLLHVELQSIHPGCILKKQLLAARHSWISYHRSLGSVSEHVRGHAATEDSPAACEYAPTPPGTAHLTGRAGADGAVVVQALQAAHEGRVAERQPADADARHAERLGHAAQRDAALVAVHRGRQAGAGVPLEEPAAAGESAWLQ